jgi:hypothetical protein
LLDLPSTTLQDLSLARGQSLERALPALAAPRVQVRARLLRDRAGEEAASEPRGPDRVDHLLAGGLLGHVAERSGRQRLVDVLRARVGREHHDLRLRNPVPDPSHGLDPVQPWHRHLEDRDVGHQLARETNGLVPVTGQRDDLDLWLSLEEQLQAVAEHAVIIGEQHPRTRSLGSRFHASPGPPGPWFATWRHWHEIAAQSVGRS